MSFIMALANSIMFTTSGIYHVTSLHLNPFELVLMGTVLELTVLVFEGITGVVADTYSRRISVIIGMFILGFGFAVEGSALWLSEAGSLISVFAWVVVSQILFGIGWTFVSGANTAWVVDEIGEEQAGGILMRSQRMSLIASLLGIGCSVGFSMIAPNLPYLTGGVLYALLGMLLLVIMKETKFVPQEHAPQTSHFKRMTGTWLSGAKVVRRHPLLGVIIAVTVFTGAASEGYDRLWQPFLISGMGLPDLPVSLAAWFGIVAAAATLLGLGGVRLAEKWIDMSNQRKVSIAMFALTGMRIAAVLSLAVAPNFAWAIASVLMASASVSISEPIYGTWLNMNLESKTRATVLSMVSQSDALGQTAGGPVVGWIGSRYSIRASLLSAGVLMLPVLAVFARIIRRRT
ncbi:MFS transporter [Paenibacillus sp. HJL G12]|uniref:MFS transporter n=1 Tax=Paenibacillus dendrobii TaxID=2691084 RepID=A0A7X3LKB1_9BACL|nr:MFS transporter [Paenibacillus dendrobii]MWV46403.1 MFS transporter [Paenibacillus dendrobii]